ncbi:hypothetical protein THITH_16820 [Thioalkalivibrio paradoxus ARh 1]|uniref:Uncharacterized protein n=1 Tax=Thioalkalivibrio paradoxus ARh 1 TaxID=713585 RepID=W0DTJ6_9GAMM|nr:hypothetical protein THITH_16820 [Thioalkalivibrio paradoxus ARh 1]
MTAFGLFRPTPTSLSSAGVAARVMMVITNARRTVVFAREARSLGDHRVRTSASRAVAACTVVRTGFSLAEHA